MRRNSLGVDPAMKDVDHDALWRLLSLEAHSTFANGRSGWLFIEMSLVKRAQRGRLFGLS